jgi:hypothetical protein
MIYYDDNNKKIMNVLDVEVKFKLSKEFENREACNGKIENLKNIFY